MKTWLGQQIIPRNNCIIYAVSIASTTAVNPHEVLEKVRLSDSILFVQPGKYQTRGGFGASLIDLSSNKRKN